MRYGKCCMAMWLFQTQPQLTLNNHKLESRIDKTFSKFNLAKLPTANCKYIATVYSLSILTSYVNLYTCLQMTMKVYPKLLCFLQRQHKAL